MEDVAGWIIRRGFVRVALQFPANEICLAPQFIIKLKNQLPLETQLFVLGDTSYGDCCVDEVGAEHYGADCVIHFGYSCQARPLRLPTLCVPLTSHGQADVCALVKQWCKECAGKDRPVLVLADPGFREFETFAVSHLAALGVRSIFLAPVTVELLPETLRPSIAAALRWSAISTSITAAAACKLAVRLKFFDRALLEFSGRFLKPASAMPDDVVILFLGERNSPLLTRAILASPDRSVMCAGEWVFSGRLMARRFAGVEAVKRASRIGVLYAASSLQGVTRLREILSNALRAMGKKVCGFCVGKLTDAKIGNFPEIDCFIVLGCPDFLNEELLTPENLRNFHSPMVTAFEAAVAAGLTEWGGTVLADLSALTLPENLEIPNQSELIDLKSRVYAGLEASQVLKAPAEIEAGLSGVPSRYISEPLRT